MQTDAKKYRPISPLPLTSKIMEVSINNQTKDYSQKNYFELLYIYQLDFRANHPKNTFVLG